MSVSNEEQAVPRVTAALIVETVKAIADQADAEYEGVLHALFVERHPATEAIFDKYLAVGLEELIRLNMIETKKAG